MNKTEYFFKEGCFITELHNTPDDPVVSIAKVRVLPGETTQWHKLHDTRELYLILTGSGVAEKANQEPVILMPGEIFDILPDQQQRIHNPGPGELVFLAICTPRFKEENYQQP